MASNAPFTVAAGSLQALRLVSLQLSLDTLSKRQGLMRRDSRVSPLWGYFSSGHRLHLVHHPALLLLQVSSTAAPDLLTTSPGQTGEAPGEPPANFSVRGATHRAIDPSMANCPAFANSPWTRWLACRADHLPLIRCSAYTRLKGSQTTRFRPTFGASRPFGFDHWKIRC